MTDANPSSPQSQSAQAQPASKEVDDFTKLLKKEIKPKSKQAEEAVQSAVTTLAQEALRHSKVVSADSIKTIDAIIAAIDKKLTEQINQILHHADFQKLEGAWRGPSRQQHGDGRDAQDQGHEHLEEGPRQDAEEVQGHQLGPEPDLQEVLRSRVRPARRPTARLPRR